MTTVGFGDMVPATPLGRTVAIVTCIIGIVLIAFLISSVSNAMELSSKAKAGLQYLTMVDSRDGQRDTAASVIQSQWRRMRVVGNVQEQFGAAVNAHHMLWRFKESKRSHKICT